MDFHITAQRGDMTSVTCSGLSGLDAALDGMEMSVRNAACLNAEGIVSILDGTVGPVAVGWAADGGLISVERGEKE